MVNGPARPALVKANAPAKFCQGNRPAAPQFGQHGTLRHRGSCTTGYIGALQMSVQAGYFSQEHARCHWLFHVLLLSQSLLLATISPQAYRRRSSLSITTISALAQNRYF